MLAVSLFGKTAANDGVFYVRGNNLIPLQETQIQLRKEVLKFHISDFEWMKVDVDFTFFNPGKSKKVIVGFVTPPADGDTDENQHPQIKGFTVDVNGAKIPFKMKRMSETTFALDKLQVAGRDFVYYFPVSFKPGINRIKHTYTYRGGSSVEVQRDFDYVITTGKRWANKQIDDFEMQVHLDNGIYAVPASFRKDGKYADWKIVGDGVMQPKGESFLYEDSPLMRLTHLNSGYLSLSEKNFKPDNDIVFAEYNWGAGWIERWCDFAQECVSRETLEKIVPYFSLKPWAGTTVEDLKELSANDLRILRNYFFAVRGYEFKSDDLMSFYSQFFWYRPLNGLMVGEIKLSAAEEEFLRTVSKAEKLKTEN